MQAGSWNYYPFRKDYRIGHKGFSFLLYWSDVDAAIFMHVEADFPGGWFDRIEETLD
jgi:hypothetical protein